MGKKRRTFIIQEENFIAFSDGLLLKCQGRRDLSTVNGASLNGFRDESRTGRLQGGEWGGVMNSVLEMLNLEQLWNIHIISFCLSTGSVQTRAFLILITNKTRKPPQIPHSSLAISLYCIFFCFFIAKLPFCISVHSLLSYLSIFLPVSLPNKHYHSIKTTLSASEVAFAFPNQMDIFLSSLYSVPQQYLKTLNSYLDPKVNLVPSGDSESKKQ